ITVEATPGKGYEYMMKRVLEQLQEKNLDPSNYAEGSDMRRLLEADANSIDKVVHQIASDPEHHFYNADGTSVRIGLGSQMSVNAEGNIQLGEAVKAPEGAPVTPAYHPETSAPVIPEELTQAEAEELAKQKIDAVTSVEHITVVPSEPPPVSPLETVDMDVVTPDQTVPTVEAPEYPLETAPLQEQAEVQSEVVSETPTFLTKVDGVLINPNVPAIYEAQTLTGETYLTAYGGSDPERFNLIQDYLERPENQGKSIRFAHEVPSILGSQIKVDTIGAKTTEGEISWFLDFFKSPVQPPSPETFLRRLTK
ncbi:MAG: hypothetical protein AAB850_00700, partial [Patescibacteria group bacterium]